MIRRSRTLLALLLLLTLPLRAMAALAMPCCPMEDCGHRPDTSMAMPSTDLPDDGSTDAADHAAPSHTTFDCCAFAMMAVPAVRIVAAPYAPPFALPSRARPDVAFVTDAPERPPRTTIALI